AEGSYTRAVTWDGGASTGWIVVTPHATKPFVSMTVSRDPGRFAGDLVARARRLFDLETDPAAVNAALRRDPLLARHVKGHPGLRVPGAWDPFGLSVRAILGQQVSVAAARTLAGRIVARWGIPLHDPRPPLTHAFPDAARLEGARLEEIGVVRARAEAIRT